MFTSHQTNLVKHFHNVFENVISLFKIFMLLLNYSPALVLTHRHMTDDELSLHTATLLSLSDKTSLICSSFMVMNVMRSGHQHRISHPSISLFISNI